MEIKSYLDRIGIKTLLGKDHLSLEFLSELQNSIYFPSLLKILIFPGEE